MTSLPDDDVLARFAAARVAVLGTIDHERGADAAAHLVPVTFALEVTPGGPQVVTAVDGKPKRSTALRRLSNVAAHPAVSLLVQHWDEDWPALWWVRADGHAYVDDGAAAVRRAAGLLRAKYPQYVGVAVTGPVVVVDVEAWHAWSGHGRA